MMCNYNNVVIDKEANKVVYDFWAKKVGSRMKDEKKRALMVPEKAPYFFGTKRSPLEQDYYEMLDRPNVDIVNLNESPLESFNQSGMVLKGDKQMDFDVVVLATGFDSFSGS